MQLSVDGARGLRRYPRNALELLLRGGKHALRRAEVPQQGAASCRADTLEGVEDRFPCSRRATLTVEADREAVRLVADSLQELESRHAGVEPDGVRPTRQKNLFDALRQRDHGHPRQVEALHRRQCCRELALAAVDHDQVRNGRNPSSYSSSATLLIRAKRRSITCAIAAKSSWPSSPRTANFR